MASAKLAKKDIFLMAFSRNDLAKAEIFLLLSVLQLKQEAIQKAFFKDFL